MTETPPAPAAPPLSRTNERRLERLIGLIRSRQVLVYPATPDTNARSPRVRYGSGGPQPNPRFTSDLSGSGPDDAAAIVAALLDRIEADPELHRLAAEQQIPVEEWRDAVRSGEFGRGGE